MLLSAPPLLTVPQAFSPAWKRTFEALISPIVLVRSIHDVAYRIGREPWLSEEALLAFANRAVAEDQHLVLRTLRAIHGVAHNTWQAGQEIRMNAGLVLFPLRDLELLDRTPHRIYRDHLLIEIRATVIQRSREFKQIPLLEQLLAAMTAERFTGAALPKKADSAREQRSKIPPRKRTKPMSFRQAAHFMGKGDSRDAAEWLSDAVRDGSVPCEHLSRQTHVFSLDEFPENVHTQILPK